MLNFHIGHNQIVWKIGAMTLSSETILHILEQDDPSNTVDEVEDAPFRPYDRVEILSAGPLL